MSGLGERREEPASDEAATGGVGRPKLGQVLGRGGAAAVMGGAGVLASVIAMATLGAPVGQGAAFTLGGGLAAALTGAALMPVFLRSSRMRGLVAMFGGVVTSLAAFIPFALGFGLFAGVVEVWDNGVLSALEAMAKMALVTVILGPVFTGPVVLPMGALGGLACWGLARWRERS